MACALESRARVESALGRYAAAAALLGSAVEFREDSIRLHQLAARGHRRRADVARWFAIVSVSVALAIWAVRIVLWVAA